MLKNRNIALVIILSIITCGIYQLYWLWVTISALDSEGQNSNMPAVAQFILMFFYVGFILFGLNADANINAIKAKRGIPTSDHKVLYIVLGIFLPIVLVCLVHQIFHPVAAESCVIILYLSERPATTSLNSSKVSS